MPPKASRISKRSKVPGDTDANVALALAWLKSHASKKIRDEMGPRYGIHTDKAFGVGQSCWQAIVLIL